MTKNSVEIAIEGDGKNEVIYCRDRNLIVADGSTCKTNYSTETPVNEANHLLICSSFNG